MEQALAAFLARYETTAERINAVQAALEGVGGPIMRDQLARWVTQLVPVSALVPPLYRQWRPLVRDAMMFVVLQLSPPRLAPKIIEQIELPPDTPPEQRLLRIIAKVPGLQKIGQVLARNRHMHPPLRRALSQLENGISDVSIREIRAIILKQLGPRIKNYDVRLENTKMSEASVSAVVGFTWRNPRTGRREAGVFKVLKPYIPDCYAEDMSIIQNLAGFLARKHRADRIQLAGLSETLTEIRLLLEREVDFHREQMTLLKALQIYRSVPGIRIPHLIQPLSTSTITALTRENGVKVTAGLRDSTRVRVAERLAETLIAVPALALSKEAIFHADPHAGNVLYDRETRDLVILDWALTDRLSRKQRKSVLMLVLMMIMRHAGGASSAIERLVKRGVTNEAHQRIIRRRVAAAIERLPLLHWPGPLDALRLMDEIAIEGVPFPASLLMFRKAAFTLDGVLEDVAGVAVRMDTVITRYALMHWIATSAALWALLTPGDWLSLEWSALSLPSRLLAQVLQRAWRQIPALLEEDYAAA